MNDEEDIVIEEVEDTPRTSVPSVGASKKKDDLIDVDKSTDALEKLRARFEREKKEKENLARELAETRRKSAQFESESSNSNLMAVRAAEEATKTELVALRAARREAMAAGNAELFDEIDAKIADKVYAAKRLEEGRIQLEQKVEHKKEPETNDDPFERALGQFTPKTAEWIREHPDVLKNPKIWNKARYFHDEFESEGIAPDTDEYFERMEAALGYRKEEVEPNEEKEPLRRSVAAPPARSATTKETLRNGSGNVVRLTAAERDMARSLGMTDLEYGKHKRAAEKEGLYR